MINEIIVICVCALLTIVLLIGFLYLVNVVAYEHEMDKIVKEKKEYINELDEEFKEVE
jgi:hypothetical protein